MIKVLLTLKIILLKGFETLAEPTQLHIFAPKPPPLTLPKDFPRQIHPHLVVFHADFSITKVEG